MPPVAVSRAVLGRARPLQKACTPRVSACALLLWPEAAPGSRHLHMSLCLSAPGVCCSGGVAALPLGDPTRHRRCLHSHSGPSGSLADSRGAARGTSAPPAIQVVTGSLNRLNAEIKQMCVKKPSLSSLNVDSGRDLGASSVCSCSSSCLGPVASTALEGRQPPGVHSSSAELWEVVPQPRQFLLPVSLPALASSPDEKEPFSLFLSHAGVKTYTVSCHGVLFECLTLPSQEGLSKSM